jgi:hypothetical protein
MIKMARNWIEVDINMPYPNETGGKSFQAFVVEY